MVDEPTIPPIPEPPPATITAAYDYGYCLKLMLVWNGTTEEDFYYLGPDSTQGAAPALRFELQRMLDAGEITIEPAPPEPEPHQ